MIRPGGSGPDGDGPGRMGQAHVGVRMPHSTEKMRTSLTSPLDVRARGDGTGILASAIGTFICLVTSPKAACGAEGDDPRTER
jgi:hypothetical protein